MSSPDSCPALVLNADFRPLSYFPLSLWPWQEAVKAVFMDRVNIISEYDRVVRSPSFEMRLPSVVSLKEFIPQARRPAFTRFNVFLRDRFCCQYCGEHLPTHELTFDHLVPRSRGGRHRRHHGDAPGPGARHRRGGIGARRRLHRGGVRARAVMTMM